jgi:sucrose-6-phosphate hydrolase SacC (GH32 family)
MRRTIGLVSRIGTVAVLAVAALVVAGIPAAPAVPGPAAAAAQPERYRPQVHFTPARNWMNDPNGLVHHDGEYHLFFQHNPAGNDWGNMSWGHAVSPDLLHWTELPVALPATPDEAVFSGSVVVDTANTSGFGAPGAPAMVAVYTSWYPATGIQAQSLAYSTDRGRTWTRYAGNPVLDIGSREFRDPKVFWDGDRRRWVMVVALATERRVSIYTSPDLKRWTHRSDVGPLGAVGGVWECPDLFPLDVDGDPAKRRWVMLVSMNPGSVSGGSGMQYFVGSFDGERFVPRPEQPNAAPAGDVVADLEGGRWPTGWQVGGSAFGPAPATGTLPGQHPVSGHLGTGLVNSFVGGDGTTGRIVSPPFTITRRWLSALVGGGRHPRGEPGPTTVDLVVDGAVVRSATGKDSETLDWTSWDVGDLAGRTARIEVVDENTGGWGHVLLDHVVASDLPARTALDRVDWFDRGRDAYAAVTWNGSPDGRRVALGWMSNWDYAGAVPTTPWRSAMTLPRELALRTVGGRERLVQVPVRELTGQRGAAALSVRSRVLAPGTTVLAPALGSAADLVVDLEARDARQFGLELHRGVRPDGTLQKTVLGYDTRRGEIWLDRTASGETGFSAAFPSVQRYPVPLVNGRLRLRVVLDAGSVEVFAGSGEAVLTDVVLPDPALTALAAFSDDGSARVVSLTAYPLRPTR